MGDPNERDEKDPVFFAGRFWPQGKPGAATTKPKADQIRDSSPEAERHRQDVARNGPPVMAGMF